MAKDPHCHNITFAQENMHRAKILHQYQIQLQKQLEHHQKDENEVRHN